MFFLQEKKVNYCLFWFCLLISSIGIAQKESDSLSTSLLKQLSLEELMNIDITTLSKTPQNWFEVPASVYVISGEDIKRSGAKDLPEALRLAPNLNVAQVNSSQWAVSARGFNNVLANKLLIMIDGRSVYTPLYAGVFWDVQDLLLEDIDRIEVISGPGGFLWGANAVNGVINIITKNSNNTQGLFLEAGSGTERIGFGGLRFGGKISDKLSYRLYGKTFHNGSTILTNGTDANDSWSSSQGGFRLDWEKSGNNIFTLQSDYYNGKSNPEGNSPVLFEGGNLLGRLTHIISENSDIQFQFYYDGTFRNFVSGFNEKLNTFDFDAQHRFIIGQSQELTWGLAYRLMDHKVNNLPFFAFIPDHKKLNLYSGFLQDEITLIKKVLRLTFGSKFEHNDYTGFEIQPGGRIVWLPSENQTIWAALSRAVRTPVRLDTDFMVWADSSLLLITGNPDISSETLMAYETGWRLQARENLILSLTGFYNLYDNLRSADPGPAPLFIPITLSNGVEGNTYGLELLVIYSLTDWCHLVGGYSFLKKELKVKPGSQDLNRATVESDDPEHQIQFQLSMNIFDDLQLDASIRGVDELTNRYVPAYMNMDLRLGWKFLNNMELDITGQNLLDNHHPEFVPSSPAPRTIERSVYGKISFFIE